MFAKDITPATTLNGKETVFGHQNGFLRAFPFSLFKGAKGDKGDPGAPGVDGADGADGAGNGFVQTVQVIDSTQHSYTNQIPIDDSIPQSGEGTELFTQSITPTNVANILDIYVCIRAGVSASQRVIAALFKDSDSNALAADVIQITGANFTNNLIMRYRMAAGTTSAITFKVRVGPAGAVTMYVNGDTGRYLGGVYVSSMIIEERTI